MNFIEPNTIEVAKGDYVLVHIPHPETATFEEICEDYTHTGEVKKVYHNDNGALRIEVEGLESKLGRNWTWQNRIKILDKVRQTIFGSDEPSLDITTFDLRQAETRQTVRRFQGSVTKINCGEFEVYSYDSGNSYIVKAESTGVHSFRVGCTCADFTNRLRVCKHIAEIFSIDNQQAEKLVA